MAAATSSLPARDPPVPAVNDDDDPAIVSVHEVPANYRELYIMSGYRNNWSYRNCVRSVFFWHNETLNIWTHAVLFFIYLYLLARVWTGDMDVTGNRRFDVFTASDLTTHKVYVSIFILGCMIFPVFSAAAHTFTAHYEHREWWWMLDYSSIAFYGLGGALVEHHFSSHHMPESMGAAVGIYSFACIVSGASFYVGFKSRSWGTIRYPARFAIFGSLFISCHVCMLYRLWLWVNDKYVHFPVPHWQEEPYHEEPDELWYWRMHLFVYFFGGLINALKLPERLSPGTFDKLLLGHHVWHVSSGFGTVFHYQAILNDYHDCTWNADNHPPAWYSFTLFTLVVAFLAFYILTTCPMLRGAAEAAGGKKEEVTATTKEETPTLRSGGDVRRRRRA